MCKSPPYNRQQASERLTSELRSLGIPRLDPETDLVDKRLEIPLNELTGDASRASSHSWITDVRAHTAGPETAEQQTAREPSPRAH